MKKTIIIVLFLTQFIYSGTDEYILEYEHQVEQTAINVEMNGLQNTSQQLLRYYKNKNYYPNRQELNMIGQRYNIPNDLLYAMFWKESNYNCQSYSNKGAVGCFQFLEGTAKEFGLINNNEDYRYHPWVSADGAARYLLWLFKYMGLNDVNDLDQWKYAIAAYNAGPHRIIKGNNTLRIPLYTETQYYVEDIVGYATGRNHIVKSGELLNNISRQYNIPELYLTLLNGQLTNDNLRAGDFIYIRRPTKLYRYTIKYGDSLTVISQYSGLSLRELGKINNLRSFHQITVGDVIYLPVYQ